MNDRAANSLATFLCDIRPDKNLDLFLRAMTPFKDRLFLVVAGQAKQGICIPRLKLLAEELGLREGVDIKWLTYYIPYEEVPNFFALADWLALPYSSSFTSQSGVLNVAIAQRLPVLASALPAFLEVIEICSVGLAVIPDRLEDLQRAISTMMRQEVLASFHGFDEAMSIFSWERNVAITGTVYREIAA